MMEAIIAGLKLFAESIGLIEARDAELNAPDVKAAAIRVDQQKQTDGLNKAVENRDVEQTRDNLAE